MAETMNGLKRTSYCGRLSKENIGKEEVVCGWVQKQRDKGHLIFIDLRDRSGIVQVTVNPELCDADVFEKAEHIRSEYVLGVRGTVRPRPEGMENPKLATGQIDVICTELIIYNAAKTPPYALIDDTDVDENIRLKYRYLDLRRPVMQQNLQLRHQVLKSVRDYLDEKGFWEIETPILMRSTPEGARDFLVPSRLNAGQFYALHSLHSSTNSSSWSAASTNISRSPAASVTKTCAQTVSQNSPSSTWK